MRAPKKAVSVFFLMVMLVSFGQCLVVRADTLSLQDKALAYVKNVLPFDMNHYTATVSSAYSLPSAPNDPTQWQAVDVDLKSSDSAIHAVCLYVNGALLQCGVTVTSGTPVSDRSYANLKEAAARILQKQQEQTGVDSTDLIYALSLVDETKTMNVTWGNVTLSVSHILIPTSLQTVNGVPVPDYTKATSSTMFEWTYVVNGIPFNYITLTFDNGTFHDLQDDRAAHPIGGTEVDITKEQAISNVEQCLSNYTAKFNLSISNASGRLIGYLRNYTALYPAWYVLIDFNQTNVQEVDVKVWADTGEVFECYQGGSPLNMNQLVTVPSSAPTPKPQPPTPTAQSSTTTPQPTATPNLSNDSANSQVSSSTSTTSQLPSTSPSATQNPINSPDMQQLAVSIVIVAIAIYVIVLIAVATYKHKNQAHKRISQS